LLNSGSHDSGLVTRKTLSYTLQHDTPPPLQVDNIFVFIRQVAPVPACWLFKTSATSWPLTFWPGKWCPSHIYCVQPLCQCYSSQSFLFSSYARCSWQTSDKSIAQWYPVRRLKRL